MHTSFSHDCSIPPDELVAHAAEQGLGAIAVTDHNVFGGALEAVARAEGRNVIVIPGEEIKTDGQGEVIGLFLKEEIPRGLSFADTVEAIRGQGGLVYVPHPFDRLHSIPDAATLHRHLAEIDIAIQDQLARLSFAAVEPPQQPGGTGGSDHKHDQYDTFHGSPPPLTIPSLPLPCQIQI